MPRSPQLTRLLARMKAAPESVKRAAVPLLTEAGAELVGAMQDAVPVKTGALRNSITETLPGDATPAYSQPGGSRIAGENEVLVTAGNAHARYAHFVEYGTRHAHAEPFFWPSYRHLKPAIARKVRAALLAAMRAGWQQP